MPEQALPTRDEINVYDSLDEQWACSRFLGKSLSEAGELFRENALSAFEDLMWMGPVAFRFYLVAGIDYLRSEEASEDADAVNAFTGMLEFRLEFEPDELRPVVPRLVPICQFLLQNWDRCVGDYPEVYAGVRQRCQALQQKLARMD